MARIRTIKPEAFVSESLAAVPVTAERTFFGLLTQADDQGRYRDHAAIIAGVLWPLRPEHTPVHVEEDLSRLAQAGLICRYKGCDGRPYLHIVTFARHQKIDRPSRSRLPACPVHEAAALCGGCGERGCSAADQGSARADRGVAAVPVHVHRGLGEGSARMHRGLGAGSASVRRGLAAAADECRAPASPPGDDAGQELFGEDSPSARRGFGEPSAQAPEAVPCGSRTVDQGSSAEAGRGAPAPTRGAAGGPAGASELMAWYIAGCPRRPPAKVLGHLGREVRALLDEGIDPESVRAGLERFRARPMHPSALPSLVNEVLNGRPDGGLARQTSAATVPTHVGWSNPADPSVYAEEL